MATAMSERQMWRELVAQFHTGMLITRAPHGVMHARPMAVAKLEDDDDILFATSIESGKVTDIDDDHQAAVTFQSSTAYVSISGPAKVVTDRSKIHAVWSEAMRVGSRLAPRTRPCASCSSAPSTASSGTCRAPRACGTSSRRRRPTCRGGSRSRCPISTARWTARARAERA